MMPDIFGRLFRPVAARHGLAGVVSCKKFHDDYS